MRTHWPAELYSHPWYGHDTHAPFEDGITEPSESFAPRCMHKSFQAWRPSLVRHRTMSWPRTRAGCNLFSGREEVQATANHSLSSSGSSSPASDGPESRGIVSRASEAVIVAHLGFATGETCAGQGSTCQA